MKRIRNRSNKCPLAFTLVELLVVMAVMTVVMGISVTLIFAMFDFQQRQTEQSAQIDSTNRFVTQFRSDARWNDVPVIAPNDETLLQWGDQTGKITYSLKPGSFPEKSDVVRRVWRNGEIVNTETYHLPDHAALRFTVGTGENADRIAMSLWEQPPYTTVIDPEELDPFTRTLTGPQAAEFDPNTDGNWRTVIVRPEKESEDTP